MANTSTKISILVKLALVVSFLLVIIVSTAESRSIFGDMVIRASSKLSCDSVIGVKKGDTCLGIEKTNNLTSTFFSAINPNLNCTSIFIGQWLCIDGTIV